MRFIMYSTVVLLSLLIIAGCGGGNMLTGGSVPIGDVDGIVYRAPSRIASLPVAADVPVEFRSLAGVVLAATKTDANGAFSLSIPENEGVIIAYDSANGLEAVLLTMSGDITEAGLQVVMVLDVPHPEITALEIAPATVNNIAVGDTVTFTASAPGIDGPLYPSWAVRGQIGTITPDGVFTATKQGAGKIIAQIGAVQTTVLVKVRKATDKP